MFWISYCYDMSPNSIWEACTMSRDEIWLLALSRRDLDCFKKGDLKWQVLTFRKRKNLGKIRLILKRFFWNSLVFFANEIFEMRRRKTIWKKFFTICCIVHGVRYYCGYANNILSYNLIHKDMRSQFVALFLTLFL